jgi:glycosyltransferase involved in cell wall biosynthesis
MPHKPSISVVIPLYNEEEGIKTLLDSLAAQAFSDFEIIVVDDCSKDNSYNIAKSYKSKKIRVLRNIKNAGPAKTRNRGIKEAGTGIIAFIDSDAWAEKNWLKTIYGKFKDKNVKVIMGKISIPKSTYLGDCISQLGFPGGANISFEKMWHVKNGLTDHITSCNFAIRKEIIKKYGDFDESFPLPGGEDPELSFRLSKKGVPINYFPGVKVWHKPMTSFKKWARWQITRGRSNYQFKKKVRGISGFVKLRLWSSWNIIKANIFTLRFPCVFVLLFLSFVLQQYGYVIEKRKDRR